MNAFVLSLVLAGPLDPPPFVASSSATDTPSGTLTRLSSDFTAALRTKSGETTIADVYSLRRTDRMVPRPPTEPHLFTATGDRIVGTVTGGDGRFLRFRPSGLGQHTEDPWKVPLSSIVVVWLSTTPAETPVLPSRYDWLNEVRNQDVLRFRNGDTARGTLDGLNPDAETPTFSFQPARGEKRSIAARELAAVAFNPALARVRKPKGAFARVVLDDGSRLALTNIAAADGVLNGVTLFGEKVRIRLMEVVAIDIVAGKATPITDLKPKKFEQASFLGVAWSFGSDQTVRGDPLSARMPLGTTTSDRGIGTHPRSTLSYNLGGKYRRFEALVGLDPAASVRSRVSVRILVDGKEQSIPALQSLADGNAVPVRVELRGAKELVLVTDFGTAGGVGGDVNWLDARLIE
jgi:hypothetical protein